jgi:hypothetical protein
MFPDPCGERFEQMVAAGADPSRVIPDDFFLAYGGQDPPPVGRVFSAGVGPTVEAACAAIPHGQVRITTAGAVRGRGGTVTWTPEMSRYNTLNRQHVNVSPEGAAEFGASGPNPIGRADRIDGRRK